MRQIEFEILTWLASSEGHEAHEAASATLASLRIHAGLGRDPLTEVEDTIARTVRTHINVASAPFAMWLLTNWWRLRWEPDAESVSLGWKQAHSMAAIGEGYAWPALEFSSDGEYIQLRLTREHAPDACAIRYLREMLVDVPAADFETAVDAFVEQVDSRLAELVPGDRTLAELRAELREERSDPTLAAQCKRQALAGIDPGQASDEWLREAADLAALAGATASEEAIAAAPGSESALESARETVEEIRASNTIVDLAWVGQGTLASSNAELPWERGARLATELRAETGLWTCPFEALDAFTEEHGLDDDGIEDAAEYFGVSQRLILSTLVNQRKLPRHRLSSL